MNWVRAVVAIVVGGLSMLSSPVRAQDDPVPAAESAAKAAAETPEGKRFKEVLEQAFGREHGATIQRCARETKRPDLSDFRALLRVDGAGSVDQALVKPGTNLAACVQKKLVGWKTSVPPHAGSWVDVSVHLQRK